MDVPMNSAVESASVLGSLLASSEAVPQSTPPTMATTNTGLDTPPPTTTTTPLIIGLISSGPDTKATLTVPGVKSLPPPKPNPPQLEPHGSGKPKAFLSMMSEGSRTSPSKKHTPTTKKGLCVYIVYVCGARYCRSEYRTNKGTGFKVHYRGQRLHSTHLTASHQATSLLQR